MAVYFMPKQISKKSSMNHTWKCLFLFINCKRSLGWIVQIYTYTPCTSKVRWNESLPKNLFAGCNWIWFKPVFALLLYMIGLHNTTNVIIFYICKIQKVTYVKYKRSPITLAVDEFFFRWLLKLKKKKKGRKYLIQW